MARARLGDVVLAESDDRFGGSLLGSEAEIDGLSGPAWCDRTVSAVADMDEVRLLPRTAVTNPPS